MKNRTYKCLPLQKLISIAFISMIGIWNGRKYGQKGCQNKAVLGLYIPPHWRFCLSSYNIALSFSYTFLLSHPRFTLFFFLAATAILGFFMRILWFRLMISLCIALFSFFNLLFFLYHRLKWIIRFSLLEIWIPFCAFSVWFSFLRYLFIVSSSNISCFKTLDVEGSCGSLNWLRPSPGIWIDPLVVASFLSDDSM